MKVSFYHDNHSNAADSIAALYRLKREIDRSKREISFYKSSRGDGFPFSRTPIDILEPLSSMEGIEMKIAKATIACKNAEAQCHEKRKYCQFLTDGNPTLRDLLDETM